MEKRLLGIIELYALKDKDNNITFALSGRISTIISQKDFMKLFKKILEQKPDKELKCDIDEYLSMNCPE